MSEFRHLPKQFPDGTRFVIEGRGGHILSRYLELPDGRQVDLMPSGGERTRMRRRPRKSSTRSTRK
jgi:hypothetical protein